MLMELNNLAELHMEQVIVELSFAQLAHFNA